METLKNINKVFQQVERRFSKELRNKFLLDTKQLKLQNNLIYQEPNLIQNNNNL
jgi:hypothetical protein